MRIDYIIHAEGGSYWAEVPAIPGCVTEGRTLAELRTNVREAVEGALESYAMLPPGADPGAPAPSASGGRTGSFDLRFEKPRRRRAAALA